MGTCYECRFQRVLCLYSRIDSQKKGRICGRGGGTFLRLGLYGLVYDVLELSHHTAPYGISAGGGGGAADSRISALQSVERGLEHTLEYTLVLYKPVVSTLGHSFPVGR